MKFLWGLKEKDKLMIDKTNKLKKEQIDSFLNDGFLFPIKN